MCRSRSWTFRMKWSGENLRLEEDKRRRTTPPGGEAYNPRGLMDRTIPRVLLVACLHPGGANVRAWDAGAKLDRSRGRNRSYAPKTRDTGHELLTIAEHGRSVACGGGTATVNRLRSIPILRGTKRKEPVKGLSERGQSCVGQAGRFQYRRPSIRNHIAHVRHGARASRSAARRGTTASRVSFVQAWALQAIDDSRLASSPGVSGNSTSRPRHRCRES